MCGKLILHFRPSGLIGYYVDGGDVVFDIELNESDTLKRFVYINCKQIFERNGLDVNKNTVFIEQESPSEFCTTRGSNLFVIDNKHEAIARDFIENEDRLKSPSDVVMMCQKKGISDKLKFGSVGGFATFHSENLFETESNGIGSQESSFVDDEGDDDKDYIVTVRHLFDITPSTETVPMFAHVFCEKVNERVRRISDQCIGALGVFEIGEGPSTKHVFVDIGLIPIKVQPCQTLTSFHMPFILQDISSDLVGHIVEKNGATSSVTKKE